MKRKGFTLIELLIVVIIIGILAAIAIPQFMSALEKSKATEAYIGLGKIRTIQAIYKAENGGYTDLQDELDDFPAAETYWTFSLLDYDDDDTQYTAIAERLAVNDPLTLVDNQIRVDEEGRRIALDGPNDDDADPWIDWPY